MADQPLAPEQEAQAQRLFELLQQPFLDEARRLARLLAVKPFPGDSLTKQSNLPV